MRSLAMAGIVLFAACTGEPTEPASLERETETALSFELGPNGPWPLRSLILKATGFREVAGKRMRYALYDRGAHKRIATGRIPVPHRDSFSLVGRGLTQAGKNYLFVFYVDADSDGRCNSDTDPAGLLFFDGGTGNVDRVEIAWGDAIERVTAKFNFEPGRCPGDPEKDCFYFADSHCGRGQCNVDDGTCVGCLFGEHCAALDPSRPACVDDTMVCAVCDPADNANGKNPNCAAGKVCVAVNGSVGPRYFCAAKVGGIP